MADAMGTRDARARGDAQAEGLGASGATAAGGTEGRRRRARDGAQAEGLGASGATAAGGATSGEARGLAAMGERGAACGLAASGQARRRRRARAMDGAEAVARREIDANTSERAVIGEAPARACRDGLHGGGAQTADSPKREEANTHERMRAACGAKKEANTSERMELGEAPARACRDGLHGGGAQTADSPGREEANTHERMRAACGAKKEANTSERMELGEAPARACRDGLHGGGAQTADSPKRKAQHALVLDNLQLVRTVVAHTYPAMPPRWRREIIHYGIVGLCKAARDFDPARGLSFSTAAYPYIRNAIGRGVRLSFARVHIPHRRRADYARFLRGEPLPLPGAELAAFRAAAACAAHSDDLAAQDPGFERVMLRTDLRRALRALSPRQRFVLRERVLRRRILRDVAADLGCSYENVRLIERKALAILRRRLRGYENFSPRGSD